MINFVKLILDVVALLIMVCVLAEQLPSRKPVRIVGASLTVCISTIIQAFYFDKAGSDSWLSIMGEVWLLFISCVVVFILMELSVRLCFLYLVIAELIASLVNQFLVVVLLPLNIFGDADKTTPQNEILIKISTIIVIIIFSYLVLMVFKKSIDFIQIPKKHLLIIGLMFIATVVLFCAITVYMRMNDTKFDMIIVASVVFVSLAVFGVALEVVILEVSKGNLQKENGMLQNYNEQQQKYYELLLKKEEDTRRYRHDMLNHMICINDLLESGKIDDVKNYLANITNDLSAVKRDLYHSGNQIADVIMTNIFNDKSEDTKVTIVGQLYPDMGISDYDLCIVLSNILKNAVEAVNRQSDSSEKYIRVKFAVGKRFFRIEEWNSIDDEQIKKAQTLETSKDDKHRHGLGTKNIRLMAQKYNGEFSTEVKDNEFHICVDLDLKKTKGARQKEE